MSNRACGDIWKECMIEISSLVGIEEEHHSVQSDSKKKRKPPTIQEVYEHFAHLYVRYIRVFRKLEDCHDILTQPQKREDCKDVLELVISKVIELKHLLVKWMPPNPDCRVRQKGQQQPPFPWEYVDLNDELHHIETTHESIELAAPRYFRSTGAIHRQRRDKLVKGYMKMKFEREEVFLDDENCEEDLRVDESTDRPMSIDHPLYDFKCKEKRREMKGLQRNNANAYESALSEIKDAVMNEVISIRQRFTDERTKWITDQVAEGKDIPDSLEGFYQDKTEGNEESSPTGNKAGNNASSKKDESEKALKEGEEFEVPSFDTISANTFALKDRLAHFENVWSLRLNEGESQQFDLGLARQKVRKEVESQIVKEVDEKMAKDLKRLIIIHSNEKKGKKKSATKSKQKKKGKKGKVLPGLKIEEMKRMDTDQMLSVLIENNMVNNVENIKIKDILGDFDVSGSIRQDSMKKRPWLPLNPSFAQLRALLFEYCVLPICINRDFVSEQNNVQSVMLYGPRGSGKTMAAQAVANELGALFINLSSANIVGKFEGKTGQIKLVHMVFMVAKDRYFGPVVIYMDECEEFFLSNKNKKKAPKNGAARFMKDLLCYKKQALSKEDRIIIIGSSSQPEKSDPKQLKKFFDRFLYFPYPDYLTRVKLWKAFTDQMFRKHSSQNTNDGIDYYSLAKLSEGYSAGDIKKALANLATSDEVWDTNSMVNALRQLSEKYPLLCDENCTRLGVFTSDITGFTAMKQLASNGVEDEDENQVGRSRLSILATGYKRNKSDG